MENTITGLMEATMTKMREMVDVDTVVGTPINIPDGTTVIPISKVSFGFGGGGMDNSDAKSSVTGGKDQKSGLSGGSGAGVKIEPIGFLIVKDGSVRMINISEPASGAIDRAIEKAPELIDKLDEFITKHKPGKSEDKE